jgi:hypothetical protein
MPEFILDTSGRVPIKGAEHIQGASLGWGNLDDFTRGYIEAAFFTDTSTGDDAEMDLEHASFAELAPDALAAMMADCRTFQERYADDLAEACDNGRINGYDIEAAGRDFWYTRNGHGVGFWDRDLGDVGDKLSALCGWRTDFPSVALYRGDDDLIHVMSG